MKTSAARLEKERVRYAGKKGAVALVTKEYREANRELLREKAKAYRLANRDAIRIARAERYAANKSASNERSRTYYANNRERSKAAQTEWRKANGDRIAVIRANRDRRLKRAGDRLTPGITRRLLDLQRGRCACCGAPLKGKFHLDHVMPLALGGRNIDSNVQLLTPACNLKKKALHPIDWMQRQGKLL